MAACCSRRDRGQRATRLEDSPAQDPGVVIASGRVAARGLLLALVALPSFVAGLVFFPVSARAVATRGAFAWRVLLIALAVGLTNRVLLKAAGPGEFLQTFLAFDGNLQVLILGVVAALALAWVTQPVLTAVAAPVGRARDAEVLPGAEADGRRARLRH
jgi:hypothetical protein